MIANLLSLNYGSILLPTEKFIAETIRNDLQNGVIEPSTSPWMAQVLVTTGENHRKRMSIDYSETINKFTLLDGYPLTNMQDLVNKVAQHFHFSTLDLNEDSQVC